MSALAGAILWRYLHLDPSPPLPHSFSRLPLPVRRGGAISLFLCMVVGWGFRLPPRLPPLNAYHTSSVNLPTRDRKGGLRLSENCR